MIVFGSRMYGKKNVVKTQGVCPHCGKYVKQKSYDARKWGHLYYIPLIPEGGPVRVMQECVKCNVGQHVPRAEAEQIYGRIEAMLPACVEAVASGERQFVAPAGGEPIDTGPFVGDAVQMLVVTGHGDDVPGLLDLLRGEGAVYEAEVAAASFADLQGRPDDAALAAERACDAAPDQAWAWVSRAEYARRRGDHEGQLAFLRQANDLVGGDNPGLILDMTGPLEALKRFDELVELLDECTARVPELQHDKKFQKLRKKYAKKASKM